VIFGLSGLAAIYVLAQRVLAPESVVPGWASTLLPLLFLGGTQILAIGVLGEYVGKIYTEVKRRPRFIVEKRLPTMRSATKVDSES
jgi:predicted peptidase